MNYWLVKSEPDAYSWDTLVEQKTGVWDGVRNYQARNNLKEMKLNDLVFFYHSNIGREVVGVARVVKEHYPDPTTTDPRWVVVNLSPIIPLQKTVTLEAMKAEPALAEIKLIRQGRLSVIPLTEKEFQVILKMGETIIPGYLTNP